MAFQSRNNDYDEVKATLGGSPTIAYVGSGGLDSDRLMREDSIELRKRLSASEWWLWEIVAMAASLASWGAIVGILYYLNGKPYDTWGRIVSLNAIISILVTIGRSGMMIGVGSSISQSKWLWFKKGSRRLYDMHVFDSASRGALGSIKFLVRIRWQLSTLGAIITILSVLVDPFAQQVIQIEPQLVGFDEQTATLGFAHDYWAGAELSGQGPFGAVERE
jgi:hypothetical protein